MVRLLVGQTLAQTPQPMQSSGLTARVKLYSPLPLPALTGTIFAAAGAFFASSSVRGVGADGGVRTDKGALVALHALLGVPLGDGDGDAALLVGAGAELEGAVGVVDEGGNRQAVAVHLVDGVEDLGDHLDGGRAAV